MGQDCWTDLRGRKALWVFSGILLCATLAKLFLAFYTYGTNDLMYYFAYAEKIATAGGVA